MSDQEYEKKTLVSEIEESLLKGAGVRNGSQVPFYLPLCPACTYFQYNHDLFNICSLILRRKDLRLLNETTPFQVNACGML